jgi:ribosomal-protein-serine acetyltransferase
MPGLAPSVVRLGCLERHMASAPPRQPNNDPASLLCCSPDVRTELSDGTIGIRAYEPGIELAVFAAARESLREIGASMRTWREGATYETAARHVAESVQAWQSGTWYDFAIVHIGSTDFLGRIGLDQISRDGAANVGYWVRTGRTGQGIATAAMRLIAQFGFEDLGLQRLELRIAVDNVASRRVAEKVGATFEGVVPAGPRGHGELQNDAYRFSLSCG